MVATRTGRRLAALALCAALAGCTTPDAPRARLVFGATTAPEGERRLWPSPPEIPRYAYAGVLTGEENFKTDDEARSGASKVLRWLVGLDGRDQNPVVLQRPVTGVVDETGRIYVTDASRQAVFVFDERAGKLNVWDRAQGLVNFVSPVGVALGAGGEVLVSDAELGYVVRLAADGTPTGTVGAGQLRRPTGLARDGKTGRLFVADTHAHSIKVFDDRGTLVRRQYGHPWRLLEDNRNGHHRVGDTGHSGQRSG